MDPRMQFLHRTWLRYDSVGLNFQLTASTSPTENPVTDFSLVNPVIFIRICSSREVGLSI